MDPYPSPLWEGVREATGGLAAPQSLHAFFPPVTVRSREGWTDISSGLDDT
jgi:hypothetical protein